MDLLHVGRSGGREGQQDTKRTQQLGKGGGERGKGREVEVRDRKGEGGGGQGRGRRGGGGCDTKLAHDEVGS